MNHGPKVEVILWRASFPRFGMVRLRQSRFTLAKMVEHGDPGRRLVCRRCLRLGVSVIEETKAQCEAADSFALTETLKHRVRDRGLDGTGGGEDVVRETG